MKQKEFLLAIHLTKGIGLARESFIIKAISEGRAPVVYPWTLTELALIIRFDRSQKGFSTIAASYQQALQQVATFDGAYLSFFDSEYPQLLREIYQPPLILFYQGDLRALRLPLLAVVGTRTATSYGQEVIRSLLPEVVQHGVGIVSGLAKGIDVMAHQTTFSAGGVPIAVIGTGLDVFYPLKNRKLQRLVGEQGLLLSEYPPGSGPQRGHFPERNRIIAGLCQATLVVEAKKRSGSLITANLALQENRSVLAIPGSIFSIESAGTNELIAAGAQAITGLEGLLTEGLFDL
ncbi:DNA-processing protein DprA [Fructobacillus sp. M1-13]|uniref:DNA-protecting protein DprA n=1 Tax=Fructobacillus papyriferae TaxID=2713171 RepID=A0ABS5QPC1_9LACO|nr:DNA-processing protein DprA [Fructobacillus papyriferae]MBS9334732.1 DNA-protecting protein DprA [Fructobacillus papyriferae]MCD2158722.1 DNA-processing protein DprA [Fructobacillus papyriferae]